MSRNGYKVMDSDMHVVEPSDLFERCLDARFDAPHRSSSYGNCTRRGVRGSRCWTALVAKRSFGRRPRGQAIGAVHWALPALRGASLRSVALRTGADGVSVTPPRPRLR